MQGQTHQRHKRQAVEKIQNSEHKYNSPVNINKNKCNSSAKQTIQMQKQLQNKTKAKSAKLVKCERCEM
jgi:hypothetical protein